MRLQSHFPLMLVALLCAFHLSNSFKRLPGPHGPQGQTHNKNAHMDPIQGLDHDGSPQSERGHAKSEHRPDDPKHQGPHHLPLIPQAGDHSKANEIVDKDDGDDHELAEKVSDENSESLEETDENVYPEVDNDAVKRQQTEDSIHNSEQELNDNRGNGQQTSHGGLKNRRTGEIEHKLPEVEHAQSTHDATHEPKGPDQTRLQPHNEVDHRHPNGNERPAHIHESAGSDLRHPQDNERSEPDHESPEPDHERKEPDFGRNGPPRDESHEPCTFDNMVNMFMERRKKCDKKNTDMDLLMDIVLLFMRREAGQIGDDEVKDSGDWGKFDMQKGDLSGKSHNLIELKPPTSDWGNGLSLLGIQGTMFENKHMGRQEENPKDRDDKSDWLFHNLGKGQNSENANSDMRREESSGMKKGDQSRNAEGAGGKDWPNSRADTEQDGRHKMDHDLDESMQIKMDWMLDEFHKKTPGKRENGGEDEAWPQIKLWMIDEIWSLIKLRGKDEDRFAEKHDSDGIIQEKMDVMLDEFHEKCAVEKDHEGRGHGGRWEWPMLKRWMMYKILSLIKLRWRGDDWTDDDWSGMRHGKDDHGITRLGKSNQSGKDKNFNVHGKTADLKQQENGSSKFAGSLNLLTTTAIMLVSKAFFCK